MTKKSNGRSGSVCFNVDNKDRDGGILSWSTLLDTFLRYFPLGGTNTGSQRHSHKNVMRFPSLLEEITKMTRRKVTFEMRRRTNIGSNADAMTGNDDDQEKKEAEAKEEEEEEEEEQEEQEEGSARVQLT
ncbi:hypothetical protein HZH66_004367 [Vespula vulgaris]|uniref:Uncharacterized protein n=1 Tax=Vespula vulgaris TaxID=7454 RepID=A0A834KGM1_VESVU|nr:hypothetical protein HZH66_004367 [Vespula vulgaris]